MILGQASPFLQEVPPSWLRLKLDKWVYRSPVIEIIRYDNNNIYRNEFDTQIEIIPINNESHGGNPSMIKTKLSIKSNNRLLGEYSFVDENGEHISFKSQYVKLTPTILPNEGFDEDEMMSSEYMAIFNGMKNKLYFNKTIHIDDIPYIFPEHILGDVFKLEKYESTYFLSFYHDDERNFVVPIYEISEKGITVYGVNEENEKVFYPKIF